LGDVGAVFDVFDFRGLDLGVLILDFGALILDCKGPI